MQQFLQDSQATIFAVVVAIVLVLAVFWWRAHWRRDPRRYDLGDVPRDQGPQDPAGLVVLDVLLRGFGITIPRDELRKHLRIDASGAISIDDLEDAANRFGLTAQQLVIHPALVLDPAEQTLPCIAIIAVVKVFPEFYILWRREGDRVQVFDTGERVRWMDAAEVQSIFYIHQTEYEGRPASGAVVVSISRFPNRRGQRWLAG